MSERISDLSNKRFREILGAGLGNAVQDFINRPLTIDSVTAFSIALAGAETTSTKDQIITAQLIAMFSTRDRSAVGDGIIALILGSPLPS